MAPSITKRTGSLESQPLPVQPKKLTERFRAGGVDLKHQSPGPEEKIQKIQMLHRVPLRSQRAILSLNCTEVVPNWWHQRPGTSMIARPTVSKEGGGRKRLAKHPLRAVAR